MAYRGAALHRGDSFVYIPPHPYLRPYIANYTITCPQQGNMPPDYTILPSGSATLRYSINNTGIYDSLRGINTKACMVGARALQFDLLLLIEFRPAGLWPFIRLPQQELLDNSFSFSDLHARLNSRISEALLTSETISAFIERLDQILLRCLPAAAPHPQLTQAITTIVRSGGLADIRQISIDVGYSERQLRRIFLQRLGVGMHTFSRIVRVNRAVGMMQTVGTGMASIANEVGFFDQPHFIHDFKALCGVSPSAYLKKMSVFYNDAYKI